MNAWYLLIIPLAFVLLRFAVAHWPAAPFTRKEIKALSALRDRLHRDVLETSMLVAKFGPSIAAAHNAVIEAAQCLVMPEGAPVSAATNEARLRKGFGHLEQARKLANIR